MANLCRIKIQEEIFYRVLEVRIVVTLRDAGSDQDHKNGVGVLRIFSFFIWMVFAWLCSVRENSSSSTSTNYELLLRMLYFYF